MAYELRPIIKPYYDATAEGKVLGMKCEECGDIFWPPVPTCQKCGSYHVDFIDLGLEATVKEIRFEDPDVGGDYTYRKGNPFWNVDISQDYYCPAVVQLGPATHDSHLAIFGVTAENYESLKAKLPLKADIIFVETTKGFKVPAIKVREEDL